MDINLVLYIEINGIKYQIDPACCSLNFTASISKGSSESRGCLEVTVDGNSVCLDIV